MRLTPLHSGQTWTLGGFPLGTVGVVVVSPSSSLLSPYSNCSSGLLRRRQGSVRGKQERRVESIYKCFGKFIGKDSFSLETSYVQGWSLAHRSPVVTWSSMSRTL